jgi:serine/threonine protein kinase
MISERLDQTLKDLFTKPPSVEELRVILFQILNALEIAWLTHRFIHNDLHLGNIMFKDLTETPLVSRNLLYRRFNDDTHWYRLPYDLVKNRLVKLIDFGRSRIEAPSRPEDIEKSSGEHNHSRLITSNFPSIGIYRDLPANPYVDVRRLFYLLVSIGPKWWSSVEKTGDTRELYRLIEQVLDMERLTTLTDQTERLTISHLFYRPSLMAWMFEGTNYILSPEKFGLLPSEILNSSFFYSLRHEAGNREQPILDQENAVVSFPSSIRELNPLIEVTHPGQRGDERYFLGKRNTSFVVYCGVCHDKVATHKTIQNDSVLYFCGGVCYDFYYQFGCKTTKDSF